MLLFSVCVVVLQQYNIVVPQGVGPGMNFQVNVNGMVHTIMCPPNCTAGMQLTVTL